MPAAVLLRQPAEHRRDLRRARAPAGRRASRTAPRSAAATAPARQPCQTDADCDAGIACVNGTCGPKPNGQPCAAAGECASQHCVDGVCCKTACTGACRSCALPTSPGTCTPIAAGQRRSARRLPGRGRLLLRHERQVRRRGELPDLPERHHVRRPRPAPAGIYTAPSTCNATGQCVAPDSLPLRPYVCNGSQCFNACATSASAGRPTSAIEELVRAQGPGAVCSATAECKSLICAQGYCCDAACTGACQVVRASGHARDLHQRRHRRRVDPAGMCQDQGPTSCGTNGKCEAGACQKYARGPRAWPRDLPGGDPRPSPAPRPATATGNCVTPAASSCFPYLCGTDACKTACTQRHRLRVARRLHQRIVRPQAERPGLRHGVGVQVGPQLRPGVCCAIGLHRHLQVVRARRLARDLHQRPERDRRPASDLSRPGAPSCGTDGFCDGNGACRSTPAAPPVAAQSCPAGRRRPPAGPATATATARRRRRSPARRTSATAPPPARRPAPRDADCLSPDICDSDDQPLRQQEAPGPVVRVRPAIA